jgi:hypothetical protein
VLVSKAAVDAAFRKVLLDKRADAAERIGLKLSAAESAMLRAIPGQQLEAVIDRTRVAPENRRAFLGNAAAVMLAVLGATGEAALGYTRGIRPDHPPGALPTEVHVVYAQSDFRLRITYAITDEEGFARQTRETAKMNRLLPKALELAKEAWEKAAAHEGTAFPIESPQPFRINKLGSYSDRSKAEALLQARRKANQQRVAKQERKRAERLARMSQARREKELARHKAVQEAEKLLAEKLQDLLATRPPAKPTPPSTKGIRPDRPPASRGIRPNRP